MSTATRPEQQTVVAKHAAAPDEVTFLPLMASEPIKLSISIVKTMLCKPTKKGFLCDDIQALRFIMLCKARALNPFEGDAFLIGYDTVDGPDFSLITAHQAFLKRAESSANYEGMESGTIVKDKGGKIADREGDFRLDDEILLGGWAVVYRIGKKPMRKRIRFGNFVVDNKRWKQDPEGQIVKCAEADALRSCFPSNTAGMVLETDRDFSDPDSTEGTGEQLIPGEDLLNEADAGQAALDSQVEPFQDLYDEFGAALDGALQTDRPIVEMAQAKAKLLGPECELPRNVRETIERMHAEAVEQVRKGRKEGSGK